MTADNHKSGNNVRKFCRSGDCIYIGSDRNLWFSHTWYLKPARFMKTYAPRVSGWLVHRCELGRRQIYRAISVVGPILGTPRGTLKAKNGTPRVRDA